METNNLGGQTPSGAVFGSGGIKVPGQGFWSKLIPRHFAAHGHHRLFLGFAIIVLLAGFGTGGYFLYLQLQHNQKVAENKTAGVPNAESDAPASTPSPPTTSQQTTTPTTPTTPTKTATGSGSTSGTSGGSTGGSSGGSTGSSSTCALPKYPDATCTGVPSGTNLTVHNGDMSITTANTVINGLDIKGCVEVHAAGVVIKNSKLEADCFYVVYSHTDYIGTALLIQDSEITCLDNNGTGVGDTNVTLRRVNIHGCENGMDVDGNIDIQDSYIHDLTQTGTDPHTDGIQITPVGNNITIKHNRIYGFTNGVNGTSAIISANGISNVLVQDNLLAGGAYTLYCPSSGEVNYSVLNNHFSTINGPNVGEYGPWDGCDAGDTVSGNVYHETGQPVPF